MSPVCCVVQLHNPRMLKFLSSSSAGLQECCNSTNSTFTTRAFIMIQYVPLQNLPGKHGDPCWRNHFNLVLGGHHFLKNMCQINRWTIRKLWTVMHLLLAQPVNVQNLVFGKAGGKQILLIQFILQLCLLVSCCNPATLNRFCTIC